jgi:hypothetical protein
MELLPQDPRCGSTGGQASDQKVPDFLKNFWEEIIVSNSLIDMKRNLEKSGTLPAFYRKSERGRHYYYSLGGPECGIL